MVISSLLALAGLIFVVYENLPNYRATPKGKGLELKRT